MKRQHSRRSQLTYTVKPQRSEFFLSFGPHMPVGLRGKVQSLQQNRKPAKPALLPGVISVRSLWCLVHVNFRRLSTWTGSGSVGGLLATLPGHVLSVLHMTLAIYRAWHTWESTDWKPAPCHAVDVAAPVRTVS